MRPRVPRMGHLCNGVPSIPEIPGGSRGYSDLVVPGVTNDIYIETGIMCGGGSS